MVSDNDTRYKHYIIGLPFINIEKKINILIHSFRNGQKTKELNFCYCFIKAW